MSLTFMFNFPSPKIDSQSITSGWVAVLQDQTWQFRGNYWGAFHMHSADPVELHPSQFSPQAAMKGDYQTLVNKKRKAIRSSDNSEAESEEWANHKSSSPLLLVTSRGITDLKKDSGCVKHDMASAADGTPTRLLLFPFVSYQ